MIGGGAGDRRGAGVALRPRGDRPVAPVRAVRAILLNLAGARIVELSLVIGETSPPVVMFEGEPFLRAEHLTQAEIVGDHRVGHFYYRQADVYRADAVIEDFR